MPEDLSEVSCPKPRRLAGDGELWIGFGVGLVVAFPIAVLAYYAISQFGELIAQALLALAVASTLILGALFLLSKWVAKRLTKIEAEASIDAIISDLRESFIALNEGKPDVARQQVTDALQGLALWLAWLQSRRWIATFLLAALALLGGSASTLIILRQNSILDQQSMILGEQSTLLRDTLLAQEAQKYAPLYGQLDELLSDIQLEGAVREGLAPYELVEASPELTRRVAFLSNSFRPYYFFDTYAGYERANGEGVTGIPMVFLSPERGQILKALIDNKVELHSPINEGEQFSANFRFADMRGARVWGYHYGETWSIGAVDYGGDCGTASTRYVMFAPASLPSSYFETTSEAFSQYSPPPDGAVRLYARDLRWLDLAGSDFSGADLNGVKLNLSSGAIKLDGARLTSVAIGVTYASGASIDLTGSTAFGVTFDTLYGPGWPAEVVEDGVQWIIPKCDPQLPVSEILREPGEGSSGTTD